MFSSFLSSFLYLPFCFISSLLCLCKGYSTQFHLLLPFFSLIFICFLLPFFFPLLVFFFISPDGFYTKVLTLNFISSFLPLFFSLFSSSFFLLPFTCQFFLFSPDYVYVKVLTLNCISYLFPSFLLFIFIFFVSFFSFSCHYFSLISLSFSLFSFLFPCRFFLLSFSSCLFFVSSLFPSSLPTLFPSIFLHSSFSCHFCYFQLSLFFGSNSESEISHIFILFLFFSQSYLLPIFPFLSFFPPFYSCHLFFTSNFPSSSQ